MSVKVPPLSIQKFQRSFISSLGTVLSASVCYPRAINPIPVITSPIPIICHHLNESSSNVADKIAVGTGNTDAATATAVIDPL